MKKITAKRSNFYIAFVLSLILIGSVFAEGGTKDLALIKLRTTGVLTSATYAFDISQGTEILDETKEFKNGNTYVMLNPKGATNKYPLAYRPVAILAPVHLDANSAMELFLKVFAAKMQMASKVTVYFPKGADVKTILPYDLPLVHLLKSSLADEVYIGERRVNLESLSKLKKIRTAHQRYLITGSTHPQLRDALAHNLGRKAFRVEDLREEKIEGRTVYLVSPPAQPANESLLRTFAEIYYLSQTKEAFVHLVASYLPYARSDKPEIKFGVGCQGRLVAQLLESVGMAAITVVRPHAAQSLGFFSVPNYEVPGKKTITNYLKKAAEHLDLVVSPDAGFQKDATKYADILNLPVLVMNKQRSVTGEAKLIESTNLEGVRGKSAVIIDDETSGGSTLVKVAQALKDHGATDIYTVVTHLAGSAKALLAVKGTLIKDVIVTDTLPTYQEIKGGLQVLSIAPEMAEHIRRIEGDTVEFRAAFDLGSSKLKLSVAAVNKETGSLDIKDRRIFRLGLIRDMKEKNSSKISPEKIEQLLTTLKETKGELEKKYPRINCCLIATEGLRKSKNSSEIISLINQLGVQASIISQDEEARIGFRTGTFFVGEEEVKETLVWDHGGGSFQMSYKGKQEVIKSYQGNIGSVSAAEYMLKNIQGGSLKSKDFIPVGEEQALRFVKGLSEMIPAPKQEFSELVKRGKIIGIGGRTSILGIASVMAGKEHFSREELWNGILNHLRFSKEELGHKFSNTSVTTLIPRALLVYVMMNKAMIEEVTWKETEGSTLGVLLEF